MSSTLVITLMIVLIIILLIVGAPVKPMRFIAESSVKLAIGVLCLFFLNIFGGAIGLHIPINVFTVVISGFLGLFGVASLAAIHLFILS
ncbi:MAG TPA: pro-sigmaK processing inhibitor BofA family protein [Bacillota bacterium]|nr:pro-sigmaK processing inhibitor BofA family protein [Bacillota bacterium]